MIVDNIKRLCNERKIKINELESIVGLGKNTIYKWGESSPSVNKLQLVADFFGCTLDDLVKEA